MNNKNLENWFNNQFSFNSNIKSLNEQNRSMNFNSFNEPVRNSRNFHIRELPANVKVIMHNPLHK